MPTELHEETARAESIAEHAWVAARAEADFSSFRPHLEKLVDLKRRYIECFEVDHPYDALLDDYEPEASTPRGRSGPGAAARRPRSPGRADPGAAEIDNACLRGEFPVERQRALAEALAGAMPFEPDTWRLDDTTHPFADLDLAIRHPTHDAVRPGLPRDRHLVGHPRGGARAL